MVCVSSMGRNISAKSNSFHIHRAFTMIRVASGGPDIGMIMRINMSKLLHPSIMDDSMISHGMLLKNETKRYTLKGVVIPAYIRIIPK